MGKWCLSASLVGIACLQSYGFADSCLSNAGTLSESCHYTSAYTGFDLDAGLGYSSAGGSFTRIVNGVVAPAPLGFHGVALRVKIGGTYGFCDRWIVGLEGYGQYNSGKIAQEFFLVTPHKRAFKLPWNLGLDAKIGYAYCPSDVIFVYGGPDWGYFDFLFINNVDVNYHSKNFEIGGKFGAGMEHMLNSCWVLKATFDYTWYPRKKINHADNHLHDLRIKLATALFSVGYLF